MTSVTDTHGSALNPVFVGLRIGLHALVVVLTVFVIVTAPSAGFPAAAVVLCLAIVFLGSYGAGALLGRSIRPGAVTVRLWLLLLGVEWLVLVAVSAEAMYLVFPLFFLFLHLLPGWRGPAAVVVSVAVSIVAYGLHRGFGPAGIVGPVIGAAVAVAIGLGYRSLSREAAERERLIAELTAARERLAAAEREAGALDERGRLAREIHDTVSQSLSSIVMLLHAAERSGDDHELAGRRMLQARDAASEALAETRQFINELAPPALHTATIVDALRRLATLTEETTGLQLTLTVSGSVEELPTRVETALLRVAQSAIANAVQHARATRVDVTLSELDSEIILDVVDDGIGFDTGAVRAAASDASFGLQAMRERTAQLGGTLVVESTPGHGTNIVASFELDGR